MPKIHPLFECGNSGVCSCILMAFLFFFLCGFVAYFLFPFFIYFLVEFSYLLSCKGKMVFLEAHHTSSIDRLMDVLLYVVLNKTEGSNSQA